MITATLLTAIGFIAIVSLMSFLVVHIAIAIVSIKEGLPHPINNFLNKLNK